MQKNVFLCFSLLTIAFIITVGCGGDQRPDGLPPTYPLTIKVVQEGKPMEGATVSLRFTDGSMNWIIGGVTNAEGKAKIVTHGKYEGAPEGSFNVTVDKTVQEGKAEYDAAIERGDTAAAQKIEVNVWQLVEDDYLLSSKTPIKIEVKKDTKELEVDAGKAVKIKKDFLK